MPSFVLSSFLMISSTNHRPSSLHTTTRVATTPTTRSTTRTRTITGLTTVCQVALKSDATLQEQQIAEEDEDLKAKIGCKVKVKVPIKVYHVSKIPELDLRGMEGELKQFVGVWKGKRISANLPFKVQFNSEIDGKPVKFFAHLKEEEFDYIVD